MPGKHKPKKPLPSIDEAIPSSEIIKTLVKHGLTHPGKRYFKAEYKQPSQITALVALLKKTVPDLQTSKVDVSGDVSIEVLHVADHKATK